MSPVQYDLTGKVAIVTGGGQGIGEAIALAMASAGAAVTVAARTVERVEAVAREVERRGGRALAAPTDVTRSDQVAATVQQTLDAFGRVDILVNNAGGSHGSAFHRGALLEISENDFDESVALNLKSVFLCSRAVAPVMLKQGAGSIINISSIAAQPLHGTRVGFAVYGAAKAGVITLSYSMAAEWAPVRVNCIIPGFIETPRTGPTRSPEGNAARVRAIALGRFGQPEEVAGAAVFFASDASSYISGTAIEVHGGLRSPLPPLEPAP